MGVRQIEPFNTEDVDILVNLNPTTGSLVSLEPIFSYLRETGYGTLTNEGVEIAGWPVQLKLWLELSICHMTMN